MSSGVLPSLAAASVFLAGLPFHTNLSEADAPQGLSLVLGLSNFTLGNLVDTWFQGHPVLMDHLGPDLKSHASWAECQMVEKSTHC